MLVHNIKHFLEQLLSVHSQKGGLQNVSRAQTVHDFAADLLGVVQGIVRLCHRCVFALCIS